MSTEHTEEAGQARHPTALPVMKTALLILDQQRRVEFADAGAALLFAPLDPIGCTLPALFASCGASGSGDLLAVLDSAGDRAPVRLSLADGRRLDCTFRRLSGGGIIVSIGDVTVQVDEAERDALTGLPNRRALRERLAERLAVTAQTGAATAILHVDVAHDDAIGEALLSALAERIGGALGDGDILARIGAGTFAILQCDGLQPGAAATLAARLIDLIAIGEHGRQISVGIAVAADDCCEADLLLGNASVALDRTKAQGCGTVRFFDPAIDAQMQSRRAMEADLRRALALDQIEIVYQPQVDLVSDAVVGFEALVRWHHPTRGSVPTAEFIALAEEVGIIDAIGDWVLHRACREAAAWPVPVAIAVNVSPLQFRSGTLMQTVTSALAQSRLPAARLELEITEGVLLENTQGVLRTLNRLRELGIVLSMDDFGTGYSSLGYLLRFPFDKIKIDQSFIRDVDAHPGRQAFIRAVNALAAMHGIKTVAEGVQTEAELACVRAQGCDGVQGYLTGCPLSAQDAVALLAGSPGRI